MSADGVLDLVIEILEGVGLSHEVVFETPRMPPLLAFYEKKVERVGLLHDSQCTLGAGVPGGDR